MQLKDVSVGQVLKPVRGGTIDRTLSERYVITKKLRDCIVAKASSGHEVVIEHIHLSMLQLSHETK